LKDRAEGFMRKWLKQKDEKEISIKPTILHKKIDVDVYKQRKIREIIY
jgi:hypothetical protein